MKANFECDLHGHTNRSDGNDSPAEFIRHAAERGVKIVAITDHDVIPPAVVDTEQGEKDILSYAREQGIQLIKGIEISCETYIDDVHLVCFNCDWENPYFSDLDTFTVKSKVDSYRKLIRALSEKGMPMSWQEVLNNNGHSIPDHLVQKEMIFELMVRKGYFENWQDAKLFVKNSREIVIKREKPDSVSVIQAVHSMGGIVILAHPYLISEPVTYQGKELTRKEFIRILTDAGLDGIEASYTYDKTSYSGTMTAAEIKAEVEQLYTGQGLIISGGSDYHADGKKGVKNPREIGDCGITMEDFMKYDALRRLVE